MKNGFLCSSNQVFKDSIEVVDYGLYKEYVYLKCKRQKGYEEVGVKEKKKTEQEEILRIEQSRAKQKIKELALCNDFEYFYTQTLKNNRSDLDNFVKEIQKHFKAYKRKNPNFVYLIIYEKHKDGKCYHLHGLVGGLGLDLYKNDYGYYSLADFEDLGFNSISKIQDKLKISNYITKYITKDFVKTSKGSSYFRSNGLKLARRIEVDYIDFTSLNLKYENDFVKIYEEK